MQRPIARPFRPSRRPVWSSNLYMPCKTFILVAWVDMAILLEADSLVAAVAPPRILPQSSASKCRADHNRRFRFATSLSDCSPLALSQPASSVSEPERAQRRTATGHEG